ncbi:MAG: hypothetical protein KKA64_02710 [Nanoarchaeota archaeon]|nr:hypothetical protein [Nanoarchaeota archaeon]
MENREVTNKEKKGIREEKLEETKVQRKETIKILFLLISLILLGGGLKLFGNHILDFVKSHPNIEEGLTILLILFGVVWFLGGFDECYDDDYDELGGGD